MTQLLEVWTLLWIYLWTAKIHCWILPYSCLEGGVCGSSRDITLHWVKTFYHFRAQVLWPLKGCNGTKKSFPKSSELKGTQAKSDWVSSCTTMNNQSRTLPSGHRDLNSVEEKQAPFKHENMHQGLTQSLWSNYEALLNSVWVKPLTNTL